MYYNNNTSTFHFCLERSKVAHVTTSSYVQLTTKAIKTTILNVTTETTKEQPMLCEFSHQKANK